MRIQELERLVKADRATIRFYEKEGLIKPKRSENGYRDYSQEDAEELERILLLRELGVTIETIRKLQDGSASFGDVMARQVLVLKSRAQQLQHAGVVCQELSNSGIEYAQLNPGQYTAMLNAGQLPATQGNQNSQFREKIQREIHPFRRLAARIIDHTLVNAVLLFMVVVILRWRPISEFRIGIVSWFSWLALVPLNAAMLHFWGTTPGKWMMGIRLERIEGGYLSFSMALDREWQVYFAGLGLGIPIVQEICMFYRFCRLTGRATHRFARYDEVDPPEEMTWDSSNETTYTAVNWYRIVGILFASAISILIIVVAAKDSIMPKYRGKELTISEFASNYNFYNGRYYADFNGGIVYSEYENMSDSDGTIEKPNYDSYYVLDNGEEVVYQNIGDFKYELIENKIYAITMNHSWYDHPIWSTKYLSEGKLYDVESASCWMPTYCKIAMVTAAASQPGMTAEKIDSFVEELETHLEKSTDEPVVWEYNDLTFFWTVVSKLYYQPEDPNQVPLYQISLDFRIEFS